MPQVQTCRGCGHNIAPGSDTYKLVSDQASKETGRHIRIGLCHANSSCPDKAQRRHPNAVVKTMTNEVVTKSLSQKREEQAAAQSALRAQSSGSDSGAPRSQSRRASGRTPGHTVFRAGQIV